MNLERALEGTTAILLDTAPIIYHLEKQLTYEGVMTDFFRQATTRAVVLVTSPITLSECLVHPIARGLHTLEADYRRLIVEAENTTFHPIGQTEASLAASFRARYRLRLADAFQAAVASLAGCEAILTNDPIFKRVTEIRALVLDELLV